MGQQNIYVCQSKRQSLLPRIHPNTPLPGRSEATYPNEEYYPHLLLRIMVKTHAPDREHIPPLSNFDIDLHPDTVKYVQDSQALADSIGSNGIRDVFASPIVFMAAFSACMGGLLFGFDQGILSIVLTIPQFLKVFPETDINVTSSAGLNKGYAH